MCRRGQQPSSWKQYDRKERYNRRVRDVLFVETETGGGERDKVSSVEEMLKETERV